MLDFNFFVENSLAEFLKPSQARTNELREIDASGQTKNIG
jgi:hypothetical protein